MIHLTALLAPTLFLATTTEPKGSDVAYKSGSENCVGYGGKPANWKDGRPVVYVIQDWDGVNAHEKEVVDKLVAEGYAAFAIDIYGKNNRPVDMDGNQKESGKYYGNPTLFMERITSGMKAFPTTGKKFAIGYCFGGTGVLETARRNMGMAGVVSFHGGLKPLQGPKPGMIDTNVLVLNGAADPVCPPADQEAIQDEMKIAKTFKFVNYDGAVHAFTVKAAGERYQEKADKESWIELMAFLKAYGS